MKGASASRGSWQNAPTTRHHTQNTTVTATAAPSARTQLATASDRRDPVDDQSRKGAPGQGSEGAPDARLEVRVRPRRHSADSASVTK